MPKNDISGLEEATTEPTGLDCLQGLDFNATMSGVSGLRRPLNPLGVDELNEIRVMNFEFDMYLKNLLEYRLEDVIKFGRQFSLDILVNYLKDDLNFGNPLYFDSYLSIIQQYGLADVKVINGQGKQALSTGFNLAFFGDPGTGKTFAIDDIIRGNESNGIEPHGLPGRNRFCGGMTAPRFIRIGEAYHDLKFNFIVPEFNDWFKYKGMIEPLKLAMEHKQLRYEIKDEAIGPYEFTSFFSVNYNVKTKLGRSNTRRNYKVTVSDPNFNAIEDRMLCRLHVLTKNRYNAIIDSQRRMSLGLVSMHLAKKIRDHVTLLHAIQTSHHLTAKEFPSKPVLLTDNVYEKLEDARHHLFNELPEDTIQFSPRLEFRAIKLACAASLLTHFQQDDYLLITKQALKLAIRFFIEEALLRSGSDADIEKILSRIF
ncbi:MAG: hypothetical protein ACTSRW_04940 [Candidatus Helarchaeota archaeon]